MKGKGKGKDGSYGPSKGKARVKVQSLEEKEDMIGKVVARVVMTGREKEAAKEARLASSTTTKH